MLRAMLAAATVIGLTMPGYTASLGPQYGSYRDMRRNSEYGDLFFNRDATRQSESRVLRRFVKVSGSGALELPRQRGYCFVFNHYDRPNGNDKRVKYFAKIEKTFADGSKTNETVEGGFTPTPTIWSTEPPDACIRGLRDVKSVSIEFGSDDGKAFNWQIEFQTE